MGNKQTTLQEVVAAKIVKVFEEVAEEIGNGTLELSSLSEGEMAGVPMGLFAAQEHMLAAWREFCGEP